MLLCMCMCMCMCICMHTISASEQLSCMQALPAQDYSIPVCTSAAHCTSDACSKRRYEPAVLLAMPPCKPHLSGRWPVWAVCSHGFEEAKAVQARSLTMHAPEPHAGTPGSSQVQPPKLDDLTACMLQAKQRLLMLRQCHQPPLGTSTGTFSSRKFCNAQRYRTAEPTWAGSLQRRQPLCSKAVCQVGAGSWRTTEDPLMFQDTCSR